ncbi:MAG: AccI family restriction endonuclease [Chloroflexota bacterium]|nr:AccI family restriction endonuclease [Chloroflexota bacterium]
MTYSTGAFPTKKELSLFDQVLSVPAEELEFELRGYVAVPWADFLLNPRRLRGSDFLMRWSQGVWSEKRFIQAINQTEQYYALMYGPSSVAPDNDVREYELYFERLEKAGLKKLKRPDVLIFKKSDKDVVESLVENLGGVVNLPFTREEEMASLLSRTVIAVECENSLWKAKQMPSYGEELRPMRRLDGKLGLPKSAVLPTVIMKEEDRERLLIWQEQTEVPIHVWHAFYDMAFGLSLTTAQALIDDGRIEPTIQIYQSPGGAVSKKTIYKFYYHYAYRIGESQEEPDLVAAHIIDKNGHILPYVKFEGGSLAIYEEALDVLDQESRRGR